MGALSAQTAFWKRDELHFALSYKRLSSAKFRYWPGREGERVTALQAHQLQVLLSAGDPYSTRAEPMWRRIGSGE